MRTPDEILHAREMIAVHVSVGCEPQIALKALHCALSWVTNQPGGELFEKLIRQTESVVEK